MKNDDLKSLINAEITASGSDDDDDDAVSDTGPEQCWW